jgi:Outer membrane protein beta-barrel domain
MLNLSDKDLDRLGREAAEQFEPDETPSSWETLSGILDREIGNEPPFSVTQYRISPYFYGGLIALLIGSAIFILKPGKNKIGFSNELKNNPSLVQTEKKTGTVSDQPAAKNSVAEPVNSSIKDGHAVSSGNAAPADQVNANNAGSAASPIKAGLENKVSESSALTGAAKKDNQGQQSGKKKYGQHANAALGSALAAAAMTDAGMQAALKGGSPANAGRAGKDLAQNTENKTGEKATDKHSQAPGEDQSNSIAGKQDNGSGLFLKAATLPGVQSLNEDSPYILLNDSALRHYNAKANLAATSVVHPDKKNERSTYINRALKIGLMAGPDYTEVKSASNDMLSGNVGITLGYQVLNHWSINTGFIYTKKNYNANGEDFHMKPGTLYYDSILFVKGNCSMYEIPLTIRYDFNTGQKISFFVNGGFSSYLMKNENYQFFYLPQWSSNLWRTPWVGYKNPQNYLFAVVDLSAGMETQINKAFSFQVEPFVKLPIKGVGVGQLQLSSYGVSFGLRYAPLLKKKRQ